MHRNSGEKSPSVANVGVSACRYQTARPAGFTAWLTLLELVLQASMLQHVGMVQGIHNIQLLLELMGDEGVCSTNGAHTQSNLEGQLQQPHRSLQRDSLICICERPPFLLLPNTPFLASLSYSGHQHGCSEAQHGVNTCSA